MFQEYLVESTPLLRSRNRWPALHVSRFEWSGFMCLALKGRGFSPAVRASQTHGL